MVPEAEAALTPHPAPTRQKHKPYESAHHNSPSSCLTRLSAIDTESRDTERLKSNIEHNT